MRCYVLGCKNENLDGLYSFPSNKEISWKWIEVTKTFHLIYRWNNNKLAHSHYNVCGKHFKKSDFTKNARGQRCLVAKAIPSLFLPGPLMLKTEHSYSLVSKTPRPPRKPRQRVNKPDHSPNNASNHPIIEDINMNMNTSNHPIIEDINIIDFDPNFCFSEVEAGAVGTSAGVEVDHQSRNQSIESNSSRKLNFPKKRKLNTITNKTPKETDEIAALRAKLRYYIKEVERLRQQVNENKLSVENILKFLSAKFNKQQYEFFEMQLKNCDKNNHGQRYTAEQKNLCLALYKQSPKNYRFMRKFFILPCKKTLGRHCAQILFESGIDSKFFEMLKDRVKNLAEIDKYCTIGWDETALKAHLDYSPSRDVIDGFSELANKRKPTFATHSLNFMVRGINMNYKQPVCHFYTDGLSAYELAVLIKLVTESVLDTGLKVIGSVCDQPGVNMSAIHILIDPRRPSRVPDGQLLSYKIRGNIIIHCFDPPHLFKVLRNNLIKKDLRHFISSRWQISDPNPTPTQKVRIASWDHIIDLYNIDCRASQRLLPKITSEHIAPNKLKMKVSVATQLFSQTFGKVMLHCSERQELPENHKDTAQMLMFFNDLFDSMNGAGSPEDNKLRSSINENSIHFVFWEYALSMLSKMTFIEKMTGKVNNQSTVLKKCESTIRGYIELTRKCLNLNMSAVPIRHMNQDGLENFFGCVKSCCQVPHSPIVTAYRAAYGTMIINNISSGISKNSNCEQDLCVPLLNNINEFLFNYISLPKVPNQKTTEIDNVESEEIDNVESEEIDNVESEEVDIMDTIIFEPQFSETDLNFVENEAMTLTSSLICKKVLETTNCQICRNELQAPSTQIGHDIINKIQTSDKPLSFPSVIFMQICKKILCGIYELIPHMCSENMLRHKILTHIKDVEVDSIGCLTHSIEIIIKIKECSANYALMSYCKNINDLLCGKVTSLPAKYDDIQKLAFEYRQKRRRIGKFSDIFKN